jgi:hypothetical protein
MLTLFLPIVSPDYMQSLAMVLFDQNAFQLLRNDLDYSCSKLMAMAMVVGT